MEGTGWEQREKRVEKGVKRGGEEWAGRKKEVEKKGEKG